MGTYKHRFESFPMPRVMHSASHKRTHAYILSTLDSLSFLPSTLHPTMRFVPFRPGSGQGFSTRMIFLLFCFTSNSILVWPGPDFRLPDNDLCTRRCLPCRIAYNFSPWIMIHYSPTRVSEMSVHQNTLLSHQMNNWVGRTFHLASRI